VRFPFSSIRSTPRVGRLIVGLGNPGEKYKETRHNVGFRVVELLAERHGIDLRRHRHQSVYGEGRIGDVAVLLAKPLTYMNLSGHAVAALLRYHSLTPADTLVIYDEVQLPVGRLRVRAQGSAGGHNGIKSIISSLGTDAFPRIRVGVGAPAGQSLVDHVLGGFNRREAEVIAQILPLAADAAELLLREGVEAAMNRFNAIDLAVSPEDS
jgi:PTH1 family peptidyl-tRNA hydrolase